MGTGYYDYTFSDYRYYSLISVGVFVHSVLIMIDKIKKFFAVIIFAEEILAELKEIKAELDDIDERVIKIEVVCQRETSNKILTPNHS